MASSSRGGPSASHALFPGTFDPVTLGHLDLVRRAASLFSRVTVAVARHPEKRELLSLEQRLELLRQVLDGIPGVEVSVLDGLVVAGCRELGAGVVVRGARTAGDFEYEAQMARSNRAMAPEIETVLLASSAEHAHISSTLVRQVAEMGGDLAPFVPPAVARALSPRSGRSPA
ncbi:MAG TPA: pantetheine-phosphate adenylyltransferase [Planctomycetota bacterium]|nr:pantetheine-phosphate adenylyltransferase [Planctomycetota bacterium]